MANFCAKCGAAIDRNATYCPKCGAPIASNETTTDWNNPYATPCQVDETRQFASDGEPIPGFIEAFVVCMKKYANFSGRASRSEYWFFWLATFLLSILVGMIVGGIVGGIYAGEAAQNPEFLSTKIAEIVAPISNVIRLAFLLPTLAVGVRRLHDRDESGWNFCWIFLPIVGAIILLVKFVMPGTPGPNRFGAAPRPRR